MSSTRYTPTRLRSSLARGTAAAVSRGDRVVTGRRKPPRAEASCRLISLGC